MRLDRSDRTFDGFSAEMFGGVAIAVGRVGSLTASSITVDGRSFIIGDGTRIPSEIQVGGFVVIRGEPSDGEVVAKHVDRLGIRRQTQGSFRVQGDVERLTDSSITVGGEEIAVTDSTRTPADLEVGDQVTVIGTTRRDGERVARAVLRSRIGKESGDSIDDDRFRVRGEVESVILGSGYLKLDLGDREVRIAPLEVDRYTQNGTPGKGTFVIVSGIVAGNGDLLATSLTVRK